MSRKHLWKRVRDLSEAPIRNENTLARLAIGAVFAGLAAAAFALSARDASAQQGTLPPQPPIIEVALQQGEDARAWQYLTNSRNFSTPYPLDDGSGVFFSHLSIPVTIRNALPMVEVGMSFRGPKCPFNAIWVDDTPFGSGGRRSYGGSFRQMYVNAGDTLSLEVAAQAELDQDAVVAPDNDLSEYECVFTIELRRVYDVCSLNATVSGDVGGSYFGDAAYFNTYDQTVPIPLDPGTLAVLDDLMVLATPAYGTPQSFADALSAWAAEEQEPSPFAGRFSLSAANVLFGDGDFGGGGIFSFTAIGPGVVQAGEAVSIPLTHVAAFPGALDQSLGGVKFLWKEGEPGSATLYVVGMTENTMVGTLKAELFTERAYSPPGRRLRMSLDATFLAQRGQHRCQ